MCQQTFQFGGDPLVMGCVANSIKSCCDGDGTALGSKKEAIRCIDML